MFNVLCTLLNHSKQLVIVVVVVVVVELHTIIIAVPSCRSHE